MLFCNKKERITMKKFLCCICCSSLLFVSVKANDAAGKGEPVVSAKISQETIDKAASPDGFKGILGILIGPEKFETSVANATSSATQKMSIFALTAGVEYAKSFKNKLFLGIQLLTEIAPKKKKESSWHDINPGLDSAVNGENKTAKLQTDFFTPSLGIKVGYLFRKRRSVAYLKLSIARISGKYTYTLNGNDFAKLNVNTIAPNLALGGEYRINKKLGAGAEIGFPIKKKFHNKTITNGILHKSKISRVEFRVFGTYTISKPDSLPTSFADIMK